VDFKGTVDKSLINQPVAVEIRDSEGNVILIRTVTPDSEGNFSLKFKVPQSAKAGEFDVTANVEFNGETLSDKKSVTVIASPVEESREQEKPKCGAGTIERDGVCVPAKQEKTSDTKSGGGCLVATATYGSELAPQVQLLRELRDNVVFRTNSGTAFMAIFNEFYYSFSPTIADWERQNPLFKETVKTAITPMLSTLSILNYAEIDSEQEMLGYGIGIILLNIGMYFAAPMVIIVKLGQLKSKRG